MFTMSERLFVFGLIRFTFELFLGEDSVLDWDKISIDLNVFLYSVLDRDRVSIDLNIISLDNNYSQIPDKIQ